MFGGMSRTGLIACLLAVLPAVAIAQDPPVVPDTTATITVPTDSALMIPTVADAIATRDSGNLAGAAAMLRQVLERDPTNGEATRHLAQLLYWLKDVPGATALYEKGMREHPEDFTLRLDYGRMLVETRAESRAREILTPLTTKGETAARASTLLGTLQYWSGDLTAASRLFRLALAADPAFAEARKLLDEIRSVSAPWVSSTAAGLHDDQPLDRLSGEFVGGIFLTPLTSVAVRLRSIRFGFKDDHIACPGASRGLTGNTCHTRMADGDVELSHYLPAARLESRVAGGIVGRSFDEEGTDWIGHASFRFRPTNLVSLEIRGERAPYFATLTSAYVPVMSSTGLATVSMNHHRGWLAETGYRAERFEDDNTVQSLYAWGLAPLIRTTGAKLSAGYSIALQDAAESRFSGLYYPYYTPENILSNSAIALLSLRPSSRTTVTLGGSYGFFAREDAPTALSGLESDLLRFDRREFNPWEAHASLATSLTYAVTLSANVDAMKTAFYRATTASIRLGYRFLPRPSH